MNGEFLELILDHCLATGISHVAADFLITDDGQAACHFFSVGTILEAIRRERRERNDTFEMRNGI